MLVNKRSVGKNVGGRIPELIQVLSWNLAVRREEENRRADRGSAFVIKCVLHEQLQLTGE